MAYIGSTPTSQNFISGTDYFNGTGSQTAFTLTRSVNSVNDVEVVVNNVIHQPNSYTVSGTTLTLSAAPSSGTSNVYVRYLATNQQSFTVGNNTVGYNQLTADMQSKFAMKNRIINGALQIWQRGTSFTSVGNGISAPQYTADRMFGYRGSGWAANLDISQQAGFGSNQYCLRAQRTNGTSSTAVIVIGQIVESVNMYDLQGKSVTLSFYCRAGSNFSGGTVSPQVYTSTAANQTSASLAVGTWTGSAVTSTSITPTTTATQYTFTTTIPSNALSLGILFVWTPTGTAGANDYLDFTGVQLEAGSSATGYEYRQYQQELALCQRYYYKLTPPNTSAIFCNSLNDSTTLANGFVTFESPMRTSPTALEQSGTASHYRIQITGNAINCSAVPSFNSASTWGSSIVFTVASGLTAGQASLFRSNNTAGYLAWSAEL